MPNSLYRSMRTGTARLYRSYNRFLAENTLLKRAIYFQHLHYPMPLWAFDLLYRTRLARIVLYFYGLHVWQSSYTTRKGGGRGNWNYWMSRESLYWHLWRQSDTDDLTVVLSRPELKRFMNDSSLVALEVGFGIGKNYGKSLRHNAFKAYVASEPNLFACEYARARFKDNNLSVEATSVEDILHAGRTFDVLFACGGVFMYLPKQTVDDFFTSLPALGVKFILITNEGTPGPDNIRDDNTLMYNFRERLQAAGYRDKAFLEQEKVPGIYSYFVMY